MAQALNSNLHKCQSDEGKVSQADYTNIFYETTPLPLHFL